jgi:hypothetical protein
MLSDDQRRRLEQEKNSFEEFYELQSQKIAVLRNAWVIETDPSRKFQYEQQIKYEENERKKFTNKLDEIEKQLQFAQPIPLFSKLKTIQQTNISLSGQQRKKLQFALIDAFPNITSLEQMLAFELDKNLSTITGEGSLKDIIFKLIQSANSQGWIEDLVYAACESNPGNASLKVIKEKLLKDGVLVSTSLKGQIERKLSFPFFENVVELIKFRAAYLPHMQLAYYVALIIAGIEERFDLRGVEDFCDGENFTFWLLLRGHSQLDILDQKKINNYILRGEFEHGNGILLVVCDLILAMGGVQGEHYETCDGDKFPLDMGWKLFDQVFKHDELFALRNKLDLLRK